MQEKQQENENIKLAFFLNLGFSLFEFIGGMITHSVSIYSDAIHDLGDSIAIGISCFLEKFSLKKANKKLTYGYKRYSVLGAFFTSMVLILGSCFVLVQAIRRLFNPVEVQFTGMLLFSIFGILINGYAAYKTSRNINLNEKSVNLHMLEDVLGWIAVFVGSLLIKITGWNVIDPILSIIIALIIGCKAILNVLSVVQVMVEGVPSSIDIEDLEKKIQTVNQVVSVHHIHVWSLDGENAYLTMHVLLSKDVSKKNYETLKRELKEKLKEEGIMHSTIEFEYDLCKEEICE